MLLFYIVTVPRVQRDAVGPLSVTLVLTERTAPATRAARLARASHAAPITIPRNAAAPALQDTERDPPTEQASESADTAAREPTEARTSNEEMREQVQAIVRLDLQRYFVDSYPPMAQRRGWEGTVSLGVTIQPDGTLSDVHVIASSGYDMLDRSAVATMKRIERLVEARPILGGRTIELSLPVVYRLKN